MFEASPEGAVVDWQGALPRPGELEVYLGDTGIFYRVIGNTVPALPAATPEEQLVTAGAAPSDVAEEAAPGTLLFTF